MTDCVNWSCVARALGVRLDPARRSTGRRDVGAGAYTLADGGSWVLGAAGEGGSGSQSPGTAAAEPGGYLPRWEQPGSAVPVAGPHDHALSREPGPPALRTSNPACRKKRP